MPTMTTGVAQSPTRALSQPNQAHQRFSFGHQEHLNAALRLATSRESLVRGHAPLSLSDVSLLYPAGSDRDSDSAAVATNQEPLGRRAQALALSF